MVKGIVTLDGNPVPGAIVTFVPVQEGAGASATGKTDEQGNYVLTAVGAGGGAQIGAGTLPGEYRVGVIKDEIANLASLDEANRQAGDAAEQEIEVTHVVPQRYNDPLKSELKANVAAGENNIPLELKSK
ncbi:MAG TPA: carboxypeptidase-like regulatory domain-containing protein [Pirellulales bacterium]|nr:carboxypeptidase-like regulatory domain-containing protein [Pirellulales bacterium]